MCAGKKRVCAWLPTLFLGWVFECGLGMMVLGEFLWF